MIYPTDDLSYIKKFFSVIRPDAILMQFTGQKDGNKKDIYEGDIIRLEFHFGLPKLLVVQYNHIHTHFSAIPIKGEGSYSVGFSGSAVKSYNVVGNIFENRELLK